jgi:hypothetical protein
MNTPETQSGGSLEPVGSAGLKVEISRILLSAVNGSEPRYRMDGYIRWGLVEREIHEAIDAAMQPNH